MPDGAWDKSRSSHVDGHNTTVRKRVQIHKIRAYPIRNLHSMNKSRVGMQISGRTVHLNYKASVFFIHIEQFIRKPAVIASLGNDLHKVESSLCRNSFTEFFGYFSNHFLNFRSSLNSLKEFYPTCLESLRI